MDGCLELCAHGGDIPPMGGKRTLRSIKKQSVPHILAGVVEIYCSKIIEEREVVGIAR